MKHLVLAVICVLCAVNLLAQNAGDEAPSKDDGILYLRTIRFSRHDAAHDGGPRTVDGELVPRHGHPGERKCAFGVRRRIQESNG